MPASTTIIYHDLARAIALRLNQLADAINADEIETNYTDPLTDILAGVEVPYSALRRDIIVMEGQIAAMIGMSSNVLLRAALFGEASVVTGDDVPTTADTGGQFMGKLDGLFDESTGYPLELVDKATVIRRLRNKGSFYRLSGNIYCIEGTKVLFKCSTSTAVFRGVAWKRSRAEDAYDDGSFTGRSVMPQEVESLWQNLVLQHIAQENFFMNEAANYGALAQADAQAVGLVLEPAALPDALATNTENRNAQSQNR